MPDHGTQSTPARASNDDIELGRIESIPSTPAEPLKAAKKTESTDDLPPTYDNATPPPSYPASQLSVQEPEAEALVVRQLWFRRHPWWFAFLILVFAVGLPLAAYFGDLVRKANSEGNTGRYGESPNPTYTSSSRLPSATAALPSPTGFALGKVEKLAYTDIGGQRPTVGSSIVAVTAVDGVISYERLFYHDTHGQIYESITWRMTADGVWAPTRVENGWTVHKVPGAVMAVNTSLAAVAVQQNGTYNTTALFFYPAIDDNNPDSGLIHRVLSRIPGMYENVTATLYPPSRVSDRQSLAAVQVNTTDGARVILAYWDGGASERTGSATHGLSFVDGMWETGTPFNAEGSGRFMDFAADTYLPIEPGSPFTLQNVVASDGKEGFVLAYQVDLSAHPEYSGLFEDQSPLATRFDFFVSPVHAPHIFIRKESEILPQVSVVSSWPSLALWPSFTAPKVDSFSAWTCHTGSCERSYFSIERTNPNATYTPEALIYRDNVSEYEIKLIDANGPKRWLTVQSSFLSPVVTTSEGLMYLVRGGADDALLAEFVRSSDGYDETREVMGVRLFV